MNAPPSPTRGNPRRQFIGWDQPILTTVTARLFDQLARDPQWDLRDLLIVLPGGLAQRRLLELLTLRAQAATVTLYPPQIVTVGSLPEQLYRAKLPFAGETAQVLAWVAALQAMPPDELISVFPRLPARQVTTQWLELGKMLANLHRELANDRMSFAKVAQALGRNHVEAPRWQVLADLQRRYLDELHRLKLWDIQTARLRALDEGEASTPQQVIVVGCVDLSRTQRGFLEALADRVQIWIAAPEPLSPGFDQLGCLESEFWQSQSVRLPADCLLVGNAPPDQAELAAAALAELGKRWHVRDVTLGVPDGSLIPELRHRLDLCGVATRFGPGQPLNRSEPAQLLALIADYMTERAYTALAALIRHPAVDRWLSTARPALPDNWLSLMDRYYQSAMPGKVDAFISRPDRPESQVYAQVTQLVTHWLAPLSAKPRPLSQWAEPLLKVLEIAYRPPPDDSSTTAEQRFYEAAVQLTDAVAQLQEVPAEIEPVISAAELIPWLLGGLGGVLVPEPANPVAVEMLGWLELVLDDAPALVIVGLHDGVVPASVSADAFLPNQLRRQLGMMDNARRYARDLYSLQTMLASRRHLRIVVGKIGAEGDPLVPSRLLLACELDELPARVLHLVKEECADTLAPVKQRWQAVRGASRLPIPPPQAAQPPSQISVTAFRDYLRCPYRFYLRHVLRLRDEHDADVELDAGRFGDLVHATLELFGRGSAAHSSDAGQIADFLTGQLATLVTEYFGSQPPPTVQIQADQARVRLEAFAEKQAARAAEGWEIRYTEATLEREHNIRIGLRDELCLIGRIDRIDYHPATDRWAIWDYKTSETAKRPESVHWSSRDGWRDLQLPLYVPLARRLGITGEPTLGYIALPRQVRDIDFYQAEFEPGQLSEAWQVANEVASQVAQGKFWPGEIEPVEFDDFERICQVRTQRIQVTAPRHTVQRYAGYQQHRPSAAIVQQAQKRLNNPAVRTTVLLEPLLIRASAGTGKTFQLTNRLLTILLSGQDVDGILATTFTRKAAGEILQRVLQRLALACIDPAEQQTLAQHLPDVDASAAACLALLRRLTASIHRLRVSTLDSFFAQVARTFALDMGLPVSWTPLDPNREPQLQLQAIADLLQSHDQQTLHDLTRMLAKGESSRRVSDEIRQAVQHGYAIYRTTAAEAWDRLPLPAAPSDAAIESALRTLDNCRLGHRSADQQLQQLHGLASTGEWERLIQHGIYGSLSSDQPSYYKKPLPPDLIVALRLLADRAAAELLPIYRNQTLATHQILQAYDRSYHDLLRRQAALAFADVSHLLSRWLPGSPSPGSDRATRERLEFRLDCRIDHLLLDEFQDTSPEQWNILRPLAESLGGQPRATQSFFCVGDTKQAIFGWRGGVAEIFDSVAQSIDGLREKPLEQSFRSSPTVMQAVNQVFRNLTRHDNYAGCDELAARWSHGFPMHSTARNHLPGYVLLRNGPPAEDSSATKGDRKLTFMATAADRIAELVQLSSASIGVLMRTNEEVAQMMALLRERSIPASQDGGNPLTDSAAVELMLSLIHWADHPGDSRCVFHVCQSPLHSSLPSQLSTRPAAVASWFRRQVVQLGLGRAIELVAEGLANQLSWWDQQRLEQLIRLGHAAELQPGRLREFEAVVESQRVALPAEAQVKVMTIHKSKGLEFDAVFLPVLDCELTQTNAMFVTRGADPCQPPDGVLRYMNSALQSMLPGDWQQAFQVTKSRTLSEMLCLLYVALTRARSALYLYTVPTTQKTRQDFSSLLHSTLGVDAEARRESDTTLYELGTADWYREFPAASSASTTSTARSTDRTAAKTVAITLATQASTAPARLLPIVQPSAAGLAATPPRRSQLFSAQRALQPLMGKLMHAFLQQVHWVEEYQLDAEALRQAARAALTPNQLARLPVQEVIDRFAAAIQSSEIRAVLSRHRYQSTGRQAAPQRIEIETERPVTAVVDGHLIVGSIDRLVLLYRESQLDAAEIIDFKTDAMTGDNRVAWLAERTRVHRPQLELYGQLVATQFSLPVSRVAMQLVMLSADAVVALQ